MTENNVVIESTSNFPEMWRHSLAGIISFVVAKGILLAPVQNLKSISQTGLRTNRDNSIMRSTGREMLLNFVKFGVRLGVNYVFGRIIDLGGWFVTGNFRGITSLKPNFRSSFNYRGKFAYLWDSNRQT